MTLQRMLGHQTPTALGGPNREVHFNFFLIVLAILALTPPLPGEWIIQKVGSQGEVGRSPSLVLDPEGNPAVAYLDYTNSSLKYARWNSSAWEIQTVDPAGASSPSLAMDPAGRPGISYYGTSSGLKYAAWNGSGWEIETVDSAGRLPCLAFDGEGRARISYVAGDPGLPNALKYAAWSVLGWDIQTVDAPGPFGYGTSLVLDHQGKPRIAYSGLYGSYCLKYAALTDSGWRYQIVDLGVGGTCVFPSLRLNAADEPRVAYEEGWTPRGGFFLKYASWNGLSWDIHLVDASGSEHGVCSCSLALDANGAPRISYGFGGAVKYAAWDVIPWDIKTVEAFAASGTSLMLDALGDPWIAYYDFSNGDLKLAHWGLRGDTDHDRDVDFGDYQALERNFGITTGATWEMGDFDYDGEVGFADYQALERNFGRFIPEPGAVWIVAFVVLPLLRARHR